MPTRPDTVDTVLPPSRLLIYGIQHVLAMYAGAVAVPLILAEALSLSAADRVYLVNADLFTCGLATLIQTLGGIRLPVIQGVTFAAVTPMILIGRAGGLPDIYGAVIVAGLFTLLFAGSFSRLLHWFPPVVTGSIVLLIGISLLPVAARWCAGSPRAVGLALGVLVLVVLYSRFLPRFGRSIAVLLGLLSGTVLAIPLGLADFSGLGAASWLGVTTPLHFGVPRFSVGPILSMVLVMMVVMVESTGDFIAVGELVGRPVGQRDLARGLRADGVSTVLGGILNAFPYTAYAQNVGLVGLTRVRSRYVVATAGALLMVLGIIPKAAALVAAIPPPALGGAGLVMFGAVAASGVRTLARVDYERGNPALVVAVTLAVGTLPLTAPALWHDLPAPARVVLDSGITLGSIVAVVMNILVGDRPKG